MEVRPGLFIHIAAEPMANDGVVVTFEDVSEKRQTAAQIAFMARHDVLANLPNRRLFQEHLETAVAQLDDGRQFAVLFLDLDHFKEVNDTLGHPVGDELLQLVAGRPRRCVRDRDVIARLGGDEFAIVMDGAAEDQVAATTLGTRLVQSIGAPYELLGRDIVSHQHRHRAVWTGAAEYRTVETGRCRTVSGEGGAGTVAFFDPSMNEHLNARRGLEADLRIAVQRGEFEVQHQPLYSLRHDRVTVFEALVRWNSLTRGDVLPEVFIALAEQTGLIIPTGE